MIQRMRQAWRFDRKCVLAGCAGLAWFALALCPLRASAVNTPRHPIFYQCSVHAPMTNAINITSPAVPSGGAGAGAWRASSAARGARA